MRARIDLSSFINAADINGADAPHIVVEKLQKAMDAALSNVPYRDAVLEEAANVCDVIASAKYPSVDYMKWDDPTAAELAQRIRALKSAERKS